MKTFTASSVKPGLRPGFVNRKIIWGLMGGVFFLVLWQGASFVLDDLVIASPKQTFKSLVNMLFQSYFWHQVFITMKRFVLALILGCLSGLLLGLLSGLKENLKWFFEPFRWALMTMPPVVMVIIGMIWFGMGSIQTIFVTASLIAPIVYLSALQGIQAIDYGIVEMGKVYGADSKRLLKDLYLPGIGGPLLTGLTMAAGFGIRIVVLAELLGAHDGIGYEFSLARTNLDTPGLFAWVLTCLFLGASIDFGVLNPVRRRIMKWK